LEAGGGQPRILVVNGSARRYGNTFKLAYVAAEAARREGALVELIHLYDYPIVPCQACYSDDLLECHFPKKCPLYTDAFKAIAEKILESDGLIIATPVYWFMASGQVKNLVDRMTSMENMIYHTGRSLLEGKVAGAIAAGEEAGGAMALAWLALTLNMMGLHIPAWGLAYYHGRGDALDDRQALLDAYNVGRSVARATRGLGGGEWYVKPGEDVLSEIVEAARREAERQRRLQEARRPWLRK